MEAIDLEAVVAALDEVLGLERETAA